MRTGCSRTSAPEETLPSTVSDVRLILVPGLGVDDRVFAPQRAAFPAMEVASWIEPEKSESLAHYAERLAASLPASNSPTVVGGLSMGGMLALEMARHLNARAVVQIASCDHPDAVMPLLTMSEPIGQRASTGMLSLGKRVAALFVGRGGVPKEHRRLVQEMLRDMSIDFIRWAGFAVTHWAGLANPGVPVHHIHGTKDWVIPISRLRTPPTRIVQGGAHVLNMSHEREVNEFLAMVLSEAGAPAPASDGDEGTP